MLLAVRAPRPQQSDLPGMTALMLLKKKKPTKRAKVKRVPSTQRRHSAKLAVFGRPAK